jgi:hypothetical protein
MFPMYSEARYISQSNRQRNDEMIDELKKPLWKWLSQNWVTAALLLAAYQGVHYATAVVVDEPGV